MSRKVKVMVLKMEVVKTVALNLDVEEMMGCSTVAMVKKRVLRRLQMQEFLPQMNFRS